MIPLEPEKPGVTALGKFFPLFFQEDSLLLEPQQASSFVRLGGIDFSLGGCVISDPPLTEHVAPFLSVPARVFPLWSFVYYFDATRLFVAGVPFLPGLDISGNPLFNGKEHLVFSEGFRSVRAFFFFALKVLMDLSPPPSLAGFSF